MRARPGYTLLEVILAIAIGLLIVSALYVALDVQMRYMQSGRNAIIEAQLARGLLTRMSADIRASMAMLPTDPSIAGNSSGSGSGSGSGGGSTGAPSASGAGGSGSGGGSSSAGGSGSGGGTGSGSSASGSGSGSSGSGSSSSGSSNQATGQFNYGISGNDTQLTLFISAIPRYSRTAADQQTGYADQRRVTYYLVPGQGLAYQEVRTVTETDSSGDPAPVILAKEVVDLQLRYYDPVAQQWTTSWDGTTSGPPMAVEIMLGIVADPEPGTLVRQNKGATYCRAVVHIPSASIPQSAVDGSTTGQTGSGTQTGGSQ
jgi:prepilin-type N-terminal cleavage/methylation domain-containing protein